ncbi:hypothetical protein LXL04_023883 [Taraxacum kok-saghyz]
MVESLLVDINGISSSELRVRLAQLSMTGVATHWFTIVKELYDPLLWDQLQSELLERFSGLDVQNSYEQLSTFKQGNSIYDYIDEFEYLLSIVLKLPESQSLGYFIGGLKEDVKQWVRLHQPKTRLEAMTAAKNIELLLRPSDAQTQQRFRYQQGYLVGFQGGGGPFDRRPNFLNKWYSNRPNFQQSMNKTSPANVDSNCPENSRVTVTSQQQQTAQSTEFANMFNRNRGVRSLSKTEYEDRRKKGDDEDYTDDGGMNVMMNPEVILEQSDGAIPSVNVQGCEFNINALVFEMGDFDMVLGMDWLKSLGDVGITNNDFFHAHKGHKDSLRDLLSVEAELGKEIADGDDELKQSNGYPILAIQVPRRAKQASIEQILNLVFEISVAYLVTTMVIWIICTLKKLVDQVHKWLLWCTGGTIGDNTWDDILAIKSQNFEASLEDKTVIEGVGNDRDREMLAQPSVLRVYTRRAKQSLQQNG